MSRKEEYRLKNEQFLQNLRAEEGIRELGAGVLCRVLESGQGSAAPRSGSVVSVHYKGTLINGREFDNSWKRNCPEAFRLNEVIEGWQIALQQMHVGDHWIIYIPYAVGYGTRTSGPIPAFSTLVFEVKLLGIA
ncbi:FKBP-type peptidyl-prolyl cis-trans isomerase [uncultured Bacteroides sp.]|uniref:FKBP-type peptidyl-prolyl cis-trans isomerase n=1 Tax=uncultured Bacteroides sp. TaxID=162156 RepID=UPI0025CD8444|nr:FKBP-type peptidyl-prolyl cis-trans isomerase [uncultured Bacteroides sp.]